MVKANQLSRRRLRPPAGGAVAAVVPGPLSVAWSSGVVASCCSAAQFCFAFDYRCFAGSACIVVRTKLLLLQQQQPLLLLLVVVMMRTAIITRITTIIIIILDICYLIINHL